MSKIINSNISYGMNKKYLILGWLLIVMILPAVAYGATLKAGKEITIGKGEIVRDNLYLAGSKVFVRESVFGDLLIAGSDVIVSDDVADDVTIAGGAVSILGSSGGDMRIVGGDILVTGSMLGDLIVAGGAIDILPEVTVGRDVAILGGTVVLNGTVNGDVQIVGSRVDIGGNIRGNLTIEADEIYIKSSARIAGGLVYKGKDENILNIEEGAVITGATIYEEGKLSGFPDKKSFTTFLGGLVVVKLISFLVFGVLAVIFFKKISKMIVRGALEHKGRAFVWGLLALIVIPIISMILFMTVVGAFIGFVFLFSYIVTLAIAGVYSGIILGSWIGKALQKEGHTFIVNWKYAVLGIVSVFIIALIPIVGWIVVFYLLLISLGSIAQSLYKALWSDR